MVSRLLTRCPLCDPNLSSIDESRYNVQGILWRRLEEKWYCNLKSVGGFEGKTPLILEWKRNPKIVRKFCLTRSLWFFHIASQTFCVVIGQNTCIIYYIISKFNPYWRLVLGGWGAVNIGFIVFLFACLLISNKWGLDLLRTRHNKHCSYSIRFNLLHLFLVKKKLGNHQKVHVAWYLCYRFLYLQFVHMSILSDNKPPFLLTKIQQQKFDLISVLMVTPGKVNHDNHACNIVIIMAKCIFSKTVYTLVLSQTVKRFVTISIIFFMNKGCALCKWAMLCLNATDVFVAM